MSHELPNFLLVGAPKCGTTTIYRHLCQHPEVFMSAQKEPHYFVKPKSLLGRGPGNLGLGFIDNVDNYRALFSEASSASAVGEASAGYLYFHKYTIPLIRKELGQPRIVIIVRNPIERAFSSHLHHVRRGAEKYGFEMALQLQSERQKRGWWYGYRLVDVGYYYSQVKAFLQDFEHVLLLTTDRLQADGQETLKSLFDFLDVSSNSAFLPVRENVGGVPRSKVAQNILTLELPGTAPLKRFFGQHKLWKSAASIKGKLLAANTHRPELSNSTYNQLLGLFREDILALEKLVNIDLSSWLEPRESNARK